MIPYNTAKIRINVKHYALILDTRIQILTKVCLKFKNFYLMNEIVLTKKGSLRAFC
ncbi:hypothetical protein C2G38_2089451 [Gigaspora rosea]|uniref:Uncharacterized protein n=1 Tax=Gigaspora rosea TaxID=44941 RepID=A0A397V3F5_9GLOM|nr:hypothetical protein C2G38_2089451 [Gigaspora rosea]